MKKIFLSILFLTYSSSVWAELDPFSVYTANAPKDCINKADLTKEIDLPTLIHIGICNNPSLNRDFMVLKASEASLGIAKGDYLPTITATGTAQKVNTKNQDFSSSTQNEPYSANLGLSWLLYDFGGRSASTAQMLAYLSSDSFTYNAALKDLFLSINQAYFDILSNQEVLKSAKETVKSYKKSYEESSKRFEVGLVNLSDKLLAETTYKKSELAVIEAENALLKSKASLATLLNLDTETQFKLITPPKDKDITKLEKEIPVKEMMKLALDLRPELKSKQSEQEASRQGIKIAQSEHYPTLSASAGIGWNDEWYRAHPYERNANIGLNLSVPIFSGFTTSYKVSRARYQFNQASASVTETIDSIKNEVYTTYQDYKTAVSSYQVNQEILKSAKESERVAFGTYQIGKESILNLLTAQSQLASARQDLAVSFYNVLIAKANLYRAIGQF